MSFETSFDLKQPKLVSALSFRFNTETESFGVSTEPKQTEEQPKRFDGEHTLVFLSDNLGLFRFVLVCFETVCFGCFASIPKQRVSKFRYGTENNRNSSVCFGCFDIGSKHRNKPKFLVFGFTKQIETQPKQILLRFVSVSVRTENFCMFVSRTLRNPESSQGGWTSLRDPSYN